MALEVIASTASAGALERNGARDSIFRPFSGRIHSTVRFQLALFWSTISKLLTLKAEFATPTIDRNLLLTMLSVAT